MYIHGNLRLQMYVHRCLYKMNAVQMYGQGVDVGALKPQVEETRLLLTIQLNPGR